MTMPVALKRKTPASLEAVDTTKFNQLFWIRTENKEFFLQKKKASGLDQNRVIFLKSVKKKIEMLIWILLKKWSLLSNNKMDTFVLQFHILQFCE